ncbi:MAG: NAD(P)H-dependent oxidoreductase subunit E [Methylocystaceae bacterium]
MGNYSDIIAEYQGKPGGIIECFHALQNQYNYIPELALGEAAKAFGMSTAQAYGVATFYSYLSVKPRGKYIVRMCESAPCHVAGAQAVWASLENTLGVKNGETTKDGLFTLELTECIGQCHETPVISINGDPICGVKPEDIPGLLNKCR